MKKIVKIEITSHCEPVVRKGEVLHEVLEYFVKINGEEVEEYIPDDEVEDLLIANDYGDLEDLGASTLPFLEKVGIAPCDVELLDINGKKWDAKEILKEA